MWSLSTNESLQWISLLIYSIQSVRIRRARVSDSMSSSSFCRRTKRFTETLRSPHHQMCPLPLGQQSQTLITLIALPAFPFIFASSSLKAISAHLHNRPSSGFSKPLICSKSLLGFKSTVLTRRTRHIYQTPLGLIEVGWTDEHSWHLVPVMNLFIIFLLFWCETGCNAVTELESSLLWVAGAAGASLQWQQKHTHTHTLWFSLKASLRHKVILARWTLAKERRCLLCNNSGDWNDKRCELSSSEVCLWLVSSSLLIRG